MNCNREILITQLFIRNSFDYIFVEVHIIFSVIQNIISQMILIVTLDIFILKLFNNSSFGNKFFIFFKIGCLSLNFVKYLHILGDKNSGVSGFPGLLFTPKVPL